MDEEKRSIYFLYDAVAHGMAMRALESFLVFSILLAGREFQIALLKDIPNWVLAISLFVSLGTAWRASRGRAVEHQR